MAAKREGKAAVERKAGRGKRPRVKRAASKRRIRATSRPRTAKRARRPRSGRAGATGPKVPPEVMRALRLAACGESCTQARAARLLGCGERTVWGWEKRGTFARDGYAYVGLAFRLDATEGAATRALMVLSQVEALEGVAASVAMRADQFAPRKSERPDRHGGGRPSRALQYRRLGQ